MFSQDGWVEVEQRVEWNQCFQSRGWQEAGDGQQGIGSLEARVGIEPTHKGFADLSLTTWVPRPEKNPLQLSSESINPRRSEGQQQAKLWSGRRELNPRLRPWQGRTLPLSYSRFGKLAPIISC